MGKNSRLRFFAVLCGITCVLAAACTNAPSQSARKLSSLGGATGSTNATLEAGSGIIITNVIRNKTYPGSFLDVIGDGTGAIGSLCRKAEDDSSDDPNSGPTSCECAYAFNKPVLVEGELVPLTNSSGAFVDSSGRTCKPDSNTACAHQTTFHKVPVESAYVEADLLRCRYSEEGQIPESVQDVAISIYLNGKEASKARNFSFAASGTDDSKIPSNFVPVHRHQCRDILSIRNPLTEEGNPMLDTFLSEAPQLQLPMNFYASNLGGAVNYFSGNYTELTKAFNTEAQPLQHFHCDFVSSDSYSGLGDALSLDASGRHDFRLYSSKALELARDGVTSNAGGTHQIFPLEPDPFDPQKPLYFDRTAFKAAARPFGRFNRPINAYLAPGVLTATRDPASTERPKAPAPIGYGVQPWKTKIGNQIGERCPNKLEVQIPDKHRWVKLWLFRNETTNLVERVIPHPKTFTSQHIGTGIFCNPGDLVKQGTTTQIFPACTPSDISNPRNPAVTPWDRLLVLSGGQSSGTQNQVACLSYNTNSGSGNIPQLWQRPYTAPGSVGECSQATGCASGGGPNGRYASYADGTDIYTLRDATPGGGIANASSPACMLKGPANVADAFQFCRNINRPHGTHPGSIVQSYNSDTLLPIDKTNPRDDFVFIVTPESVMSHNIFGDDGTPDEIGRQYTPVRAKNPAACAGKNLITDPSCSDENDSHLLTYAPLRYDLNLTHSETFETGSDPGETLDSPVSFPMCVLQEDPS